MKPNDSKSQRRRKCQGLAKNTAHYTLECLYYFLWCLTVCWHNHPLYPVKHVRIFGSDGNCIPPLHFNFEGIPPPVVSNLAIHPVIVIYFVL